MSHATVAENDIKCRITAALKANGGKMQYAELRDATFPTEQYPRAFNYQSNGGPPGCQMAFARAMKQLLSNQRVSVTGQSKNHYLNHTVWLNDTNTVWLDDTIGTKD